MAGARPGALTAFTVALAATFISEHYGGPQILYAPFFGRAFNFLAGEAKTKPGIDFDHRRAADRRRGGDLRASAALAISAALPKNADNQRFLGGLALLQRIG